MRMFTSVVCALLLLGLTLARRGAERGELAAAQERAELSIAAQRDANRLQRCCPASHALAESDGSGTGVLEPLPNSSIEGVACGAGELRCLVPERPGELAALLMKIAASQRGQDAQGHHRTNLRVLSWDWLQLLHPRWYHLAYRRGAAARRGRSRMRRATEPVRYAAVPARLLRADGMVDDALLAADAELAADGFEESRLRLLLHPNAWRFFELGLHEPMRLFFDEKIDDALEKAKAAYSRALERIEALLAPFSSLPWSKRLRADVIRVMDERVEGHQEEARGVGRRGDTDAESDGDSEDAAAVDSGSGFESLGKDEV